MSPSGPLPIASFEIVRPEFLIGDAITHHVVRDFEDLVAHGDDGFLMAAMAFDPVIASLQGGPARPRGRQSRFDQRAAQISVPVSRFARVPLPAALVLAGAHGAPTA